MDFLFNFLLIFHYSHQRYHSDEMKGSLLNKWILFNSSTRLSCCLDSWRLKVPQLCTSQSSVTYSSQALWSVTTSSADCFLNAKDLNRVCLCCYACIVFVSDKAEKDWTIYLLTSEVCRGFVPGIIKQI